MPVPDRVPPKAISVLPEGSIPALVTPMHEDGSIDWKSLGTLIDWHATNGSDALVVMGSTAESATVSLQEHADIIAFAVDKAHGRLPIIAGTGANSTAEAIELTRSAKKAGVTTVLSVVPYYNKPTQDGIYAHYRTIAETVDVPIILYNVPGRTVADMANETILRLAQIPNIVGLKDATGDTGRAVMLMRYLPDNFVLYSGDDATAASLILLGARGNISVTANVIPALMHVLCNAAQNGDVPTVRAIGRQIAPLNEAMFIETNPIPVKWALAYIGKLPLASYRLPMTALSAAGQAQVANALRLATEIEPHSLRTA